eukprot:2446721-Pyramimonas_sp.AAC.1
MVPDQSALITVADEQRGQLPKRGRTRDPDTEETYYAPLCSMIEDDSSDSTLTKTVDALNCALRQECQR